MDIIDKLEKKIGRFAIKHLIRYIIAIYAIGFLVWTFWPDVYMTYLGLDVSKVLEGQVWRIFTFLLQPTDTNVLFALISLYFYYFLGSLIESVWGAFKFNLYYFTGWLLTVIAAFVIHFAFGYDMMMSIYYINIAMFLAFASIIPDQVLLLFFVIPIKVKWLAYLDGALLAATIIFGYAYNFLPYNVLVGLYQMGLPAHPVYATEALVAVINFGLFMLLTWKKIRTKTQKAFMDAQKAAKKQAEERIQRESYKQKLRPNAGGAKHKCAVCGRTELDDENLEFRFCSKCEGNYEYCSDHLYTHIHVNNQQ